MKGAGSKRCHYRVELPEIHCGDPALERAVNARLAPQRHDVDCSDELVWDSDNSSSGTHLPAPNELEYTGVYGVRWNAHGILAIWLSLTADVRTAQNAILRDETLVLDLERGGREIAFHEVVDRARDRKAWTELVSGAVRRRLSNDATSAEVVATVTVESDVYVPTETGVALCPGGLPQAFAGLGGCDYVLEFAELAPFWVPGNPLERIAKKQ